MLLLMIIGATMGQLFAQAFIDYAVVDVLNRVIPFRWIMRLAGIKSAQHFRYKLITNNTAMVIWNIMWMVPIGSFLGMGGAITGIAGAFGNVIWGFITHFILRNKWERAYIDWANTNKKTSAVDQIKQKIRKDIIAHAKKEGVIFDNDQELERIIEREFQKSPDSIDAMKRASEQESKKRSFMSSYSYQVK